MGGEKGVLIGVWRGRHTTISFLLVEDFCGACFLSISTRLETRLHCCDFAEVGLPCKYLPGETGRDAENLPWAEERKRGRGDSEPWCKFRMLEIDMILGFGRFVSLTAGGLGVGNDLM